MLLTCCFSFATIRTCTGALRRTLVSQFGPRLASAISGRIVAMPLIHIGPSVLWEACRRVRHPSAVVCACAPGSSAHNAPRQRTPGLGLCAAVDLVNNSSLRRRSIMGRKGLLRLGPEASGCEAVWFIGRRHAAGIGLLGGVRCLLWPWQHGSCVICGSPSGICSSARGCSVFGSFSIYNYVEGPWQAHWSDTMNCICRTHCER